MDEHALIGAQVEVAAPDGRRFRFCVHSLVPYAGKPTPCLSTRRTASCL